MSPHPCPDLEQLFTELEAGEGPALDHAAECDACAGVLEEHRLLEQDLYRLADPLPPPTLVASVMARVAEEPVPRQREVWSGLIILVTSISMGLGYLISNDRALGRLGTTAASTVVNGRVFFEGLLSGAHALWSTVGVSIAGILALLLLTSLFGLKRLVGGSPSLTEA
ncbi:hypothetical protein DRW03_08900 [Corallococcus sp. H22C18031201]|uniref:hypothetical protein n=1 Tax=Citreicoccus inhibens TaxID=2849499 RepID=UPI000E713FC1|nr:hypothetical protein [Citreicoccus inhibens]MBU8894627.1 hypothetical protein [Citreicoccus inhibens]RJS25211.1 hypothetical protein DRW03_08900 [Corallococcus sp. H22C18031201]